MMLAACQRPMMPPKPAFARFRFPPEAIVVAVRWYAPAQTDARATNGQHSTGHHRRTCLHACRTFAAATPNSPSTPRPLGGSQPRSPNSPERSDRRSDTGSTRPPIPQRNGRPRTCFVRRAAPLWDRCPGSTTTKVHASWSMTRRRSRTRRCAMRACSTASALTSFRWFRSSICAADSKFSATRAVRQPQVVNVNRGLSHGAGGDCAVIARAGPRAVVPAAPLGRWVRTGRRTADRVRWCRCRRGRRCRGRR